MIGVYKFTNKYNRKVYVGKSKDIEQRYKTHKKTAINSTDDFHWSRALRKYGFIGYLHEQTYDPICKTS